MEEGFKAAARLPVKLIPPWLTGAYFHDFEAWEPHSLSRRFKHEQVQSAFITHLVAGAVKVSAIKALAAKRLD